MSYDRQIDQVCPHGVLEEALYVNADRRSIRPLRPISSINSVKVRLNGEIEVPSMGVALAASSRGVKEGPFNVITGSNDVFSIAVNQGATQTVVLPSGNKMPAARVAALLNASLTGILFSVVGDKLAFKTLTEGRGSSVFVKSTSTLASTLGITANREYRGLQNVPGWTLIADPGSLPDRPTRLIVFDEPLRSGSCHVEVGYTTVRQECRRCGGTGVENDFRYSGDGEPIAVRNENLLLQELQKDFYTIQGSNPFHTWYGTSLLESIGKKLTAGGFVQNLIVSDIYQAFNRWQFIKRQQEERVGQVVTDAEFPFRLLSVDLQQSTQDPTVVFVSITVQNRSNAPIQLERGLRVPQPTDLLGSTAQQGVIRQSLSNYVLTG